MTALSNYLENEILDHALGTAAYTAPAAVYLALFTTDPTDSNIGSELTGNGYARQVATFSASSGGTTANTAEIVFSASGGNFGTVSHSGIYDAPTGGNLLFHNALTTSRVVNDGESLTFAIGAITASLD